MTRLTTLKPSEATGETAVVFDQIKTAIGKVPECLCDHRHTQSRGSLGDAARGRRYCGEFARAG